VLKTVRRKEPLMIAERLRDLFQKYQQSRPGSKQKGVLGYPWLYVYGKFAQYAFSSESFLLEVVKQPGGVLGRL
jgi:hypothetical protein